MKRIMPILIVLILLTTSFSAYALDVNDMPQAVTQEDIDNQENPFDFVEYLKTTVVPAIAAVATSIGAVFVALTPLINKIRNAKTQFDTSVEKIEEVSKNGEDVTKATEELASQFQEKAQVILDNFIHSITEQDERIKRIEAYSQDTRTIAITGFTNIDELVTKGIAREIAKYDLTKRIERDEANGKEEEIKSEDKNATDSTLVH